MGNFFSKLIRLFMSMLLCFRYRVKVRGKEVLKNKDLKNGPVLILPNHPALFIDPFILYKVLSKRIKVIPLVAETMFSTPGAKPFMRMVGAKPVPEFDTAINEYKYKKAKEFHDSIVKDLKEGKRILLYPAGGLKRQGKELVGGRSLAHRLVQEVPETQIVLARMTGPLGEPLSTYFTGETPYFWSVVLSGFLSLLKNLIFFMPKRKILLEFARPDKDFPRHKTRQDLIKLWKIGTTSTNMVIRCK